jgi:glycerol-3-phosphate cytidylyltransferase
MGKRVITYGTFDMFHIGHLELLKRVKELGDELIVAVSTDEFNDIKGKKTIIPYSHRSEIVKAIKYVNRVIPEKSWEQKIEDIKEYNIDLFVIGDDWEGEFDFLKEYCDVIYLPRTKNISSTQLKNSLNSAFEIIESLKKDLE